MMTRHRQQSGFTVVELLVAISVTVLLMTMIFQLFQTTQRAVSTGIKLGEMMVESETIGNQIHRDAEAMLPPSGGDDAGFLVIVQRRLDDVPLRTSTGDINADIRSDQLTFIREPRDGRDEIGSLTPKHQQTLGTDIQATRARVWYGHALRTLPDGTALTDDADEIVGLGETGPDDTSPNRYANTWVLARQALLLAQDGDGNFDTNETPAPIRVEADDLANDPSATWSNSVVPEYGPVDSPQLFHGLTDVANQTLEEIIDDHIDEYFDDVLPFAVPDNRPWVNPDPDTAYFEPWRLAQMHTYLSGKVSDIIIDFAGDYDDDATGNEHPANEGQINRDDDGNIIWYSHFHGDPGPVTYEPPESFQNVGTPDQNDAYYITGGDLPAEYEEVADAIFVFRHDDDDAEKWPYLIRIRYRMHDLRGDVGRTRYTPDLDYPGIIRSDAWDDEPTPGRWFEHVIRVQRPD